MINYRKLNFFNIFATIRICFYILLFLLFIIMPTSFFESGSICMLFNRTHFLCPTCGVTRAFSSLMHLDFYEAFIYNPIFTLTIAPICIFLFVQEIITYIIRITKNDKERLSIIEYIALKVF